ncbi:hypothetical protein Tco_0163397 [Tanacetum coccineum]
MGKKMMYRAFHDVQRLRQNVNNFPRIAANKCSLVLLWPSQAASICKKRSIKQFLNETIRGFDEASTQDAHFLLLILDEHESILHTAPLPYLCIQSQPNGAMAPSPVNKPLMGVVPKQPTGFPPLGAHGVSGNDMNQIVIDKI